MVVVLRCDNGILYPRLQSRGYSEKKLSDNMEAEIMQVILDEARESYREEIVVELSSNDAESMDANVGRICAWIEQWRADHASG